MLIEQIFELRGFGPRGRICTPITGCFHLKTIMSKENFRVDCYSLQKIGGNVLYFPLPGPSHLQNLARVATESAKSNSRTFLGHFPGLFKFFFNRT